MSTKVCTCICIYVALKYSLHGPCMHSCNNQRSIIILNTISLLCSEWEKEIQKHKSGKKANLRLAMARAFWLQYALTGFIILLRVPYLL